jgi:hypothetical protein
LSWWQNSSHIIIILKKNKLVFNAKKNLLSEKCDVMKDEKKQTVNSHNAVTQQGFMLDFYTEYLIHHEEYVS